MAKDLMDWAPKEAPAASEADDEAEPKKPDLAEARLLHLAEATGVEDPAALVKLVRACCEQYKAAPAKED